MAQEPWGGEVHMPRWLRHLLHRPDPPGDTPERVHEARQPQVMPTVGENADRAIAGPMTELYWEGRAARRRAAPRRDE
jgi:hypothetical protein